MDDGTWYVCPVCEVEVELMSAVPHILAVHPHSGVAKAIRAEVDRAWVKSLWVEKEVRA
jgi:hypothetical protein